MTSRPPRSWPLVAVVGLALAAGLAAASARGCACGNTMGGTAGPATGGSATAGGLGAGTGSGSGAATGASTSVPATGLGMDPGPMTIPPGFDVAALGAHERECFVKTVNDLLSPCGQPMTIAACVESKADCALCGRIARLVYRDCAEGLPPPIVQECAVNSILSLQAAPVTIDVSGAPTKGGAPEAPIKLIEFSDFECPHCKEMAPVLGKVVGEFDGKVVMHFKHFPLSFHEFAPNAAAASIAAGLQGKFWEFHDKIFAHQDELKKPELLDSLARELGLDVTKFNADRVAKSTLERLSADYDAGDTAGVKGTPTIFVNGHKFEDYPEYAQLKAWLQEELPH
jgi:protein-disulfide isomerase